MVCAGKIPTTTQARTRRSSGRRIQPGGSRGARGSIAAARLFAAAQLESDRQAATAIDWLDEPHDDLLAATSGAKHLWRKRALVVAIGNHLSRQREATEYGRDDQGASNHRPTPRPAG